MRPKAAQIYGRSFRAAKDPVRTLGCTIFHAMCWQPLRVCQKYVLGRQPLGVGLPRPAAAAVRRCLSSGEGALCCSCLELLLLLVQDPSATTTEPGVSTPRTSTTLINTSEHYYNISVFFTSKTTRNQRITLRFAVIMF